MIYNWKTFACDLHYTLGTSKFVLLTWLSTATFYVSTKYVYLEKDVLNI